MKMSSMVVHHSLLFPFFDMLIGVWCSLIHFIKFISMDDGCFKILIYMNQINPITFECPACNQPYS